MGFLSVPNLVHSWIFTDQFCWITFYFNLTEREYKEEKMLLTINQGMAIIIILLGKYGTSIQWHYFPICIKIKNQMEI